MKTDYEIMKTGIAMVLAYAIYYLIFKEEMNMLYTGLGAIFFSILFILWKKLGEWTESIK